MREIDMGGRMRLAGILVLASAIAGVSVHRDGSLIGGWNPAVWDGSGVTIAPASVDDPVQLSSIGTIGADSRDRSDEPYNFRASDAYAALSDEDRRMLDRVHRDMVLLWGALDLYADEHGGEPPESLEDLVPIFLQSLPIDPFAGVRALQADAQIEDPMPGYRSSLRGIGYHYRRGQGRSWIIASVGLPAFPYLAERGNVGLYLPKGTWISGVQPMMIEEQR